MSLEESRRAQSFRTYGQRKTLWFVLVILCRVTVHGTLSDHQSLIDWSLADPGPELVLQFTLSFLLSDDNDPHCHFLTDLSLMNNRRARVLGAARICASTS